MNKSKKYGLIGLTSAAVLLVGGLSVGNAMAYFTTNAFAAGTQTVSLGAKTTIEEEFSNWTKRITIKNISDKNACYVRVKAFCGSQFAIEYSSTEGDWEQRDGDDYWYYTKVVPAGGETSQLLAHITVPEEQKDDFNVVVIQECTPALYDAGGNPYADWTQKVDVTSGFDEREDEKR